MPNSQRPDMLHALNEAALAIAEGLSLPRTLQRIADTARVLVDVKYAALGVLGDELPELKQFITSGLEPQRSRHIHHEPMGRGLLGLILEQPIRIENIAADPRSAGFCQGHPHMKTFLGVPITNRGKRLGNLYLSDRLDGAPFTAEDEEMLMLLAAHAAIAIENARLHEDLQSIALRSERDRIGMDLHDGVIQSIYAVGMKVEILFGKAQLSPDQQAQQQAILQDLNRIIDEIRGYIQNLISHHDEQTTLRQKVENLITHFRDFSGVKVRYEIAEGLSLLSDHQRHNILQMLREALANIARHAGATEAQISFRQIDKEIWLTIKDNGRGFDPEVVDVPNHFGLHNIEQRARRLGGRVEMTSAPGEGTTMIIKIPVGIN